MMKQYKLINQEETKGVWVDERIIIDLIKICKHRNKILFIKLIEWYEYLENKTFDENLIKNKTRYM